MKKFIVTYHMPSEVMAKSMNTPPEEAAKGMEEWMKWAKKCGSNLVDLGTPLSQGIKLRPQGAFEESNREVCGYSILQANDMDHAKELLNGHPHLSGWDDSCEIEVHEAMPLPGEG